MTAEPIMSRSANGSRNAPNSDSCERRLARKPSSQSVEPIPKMRSAARPIRSWPRSTYQKYGIASSRAKEIAFGMVQTRSNIPAMLRPKLSGPRLGAHTAFSTR